MISYRRGLGNSNRYEFKATNQHFVPTEEAKQSTQQQKTQFGEYSGLAQSKEEGPKFTRGGGGKPGRKWLLKWLMMLPSWTAQGKGVRDVFSLVSTVSTVMYDTQ